ncbi:hypothetical protein H0E84_02290 [Luteimonas sp. SJ-92]|uniref:Uncharacterized protein n=1 Tax=Luteimonas salinisoli TaxID=2752307 RepID=A0A853J978_9GAMM|nr:hypothetical protein [Luteimonas salinisoli]NZA25200.1 hypothetical protein [Luteimonas salinisoli]
MILAATAIAIAIAIALVIVIVIAAPGLVARCIAGVVAAPDRIAWPSRWHGVRRVAT